MEMVQRELNKYVYPILFLVFMSICFGLGYSTLVRFDPTQSIGLNDTIDYLNIVENGLNNIELDQSGRSTRILVPYLAHIFYLILPQLGSWNMITFSMLIVCAAFTSFNALIIFNLTLNILSNSRIGLLASFLFLTSFEVSNTFLISYVDSAYTFWLSCLVFLLYYQKLYWLPLIAILASMTKETFLPVGSSFLLGWLMYEYLYGKGFDKNKLFIVLITILFSLVTLFTIDMLMLGDIYYPWEKMAALKAEPTSYNKVDLFFHKIIRFLMVLGALVILAIPYLRKLPSIILFATLISCIAVIFLGSWSGIGGAGFARGIFSASSFVLCSSAAHFLYSLINNLHLKENEFRV